jgi:hypothetical protein
MFLMLVDGLFWKLTFVIILLFFIVFFSFGFIEKIFYGIWEDFDENIVGVRDWSVDKKLEGRINTKNLLVVVIFFRNFENEKY